MKRKVKLSPCTRPGISWQEHVSSSQRQSLHPAQNSKGKGKVFSYSLPLPSIGPWADLDVQAVSPQVTWSESRHRPGITFCQACGYLRSFHQMVLPVNCSTHLIPAYYSFIDPERMKGWVVLVGWSVADGLPTTVVTYQLPVERRIGKVRQSKTDVLPLCHATNLHRTLSKVNAYSCLYLHCHTTTGSHVPYGITLCYLPPGSSDISAFTLAKTVLHTQRRIVVSSVHRMNKVNARRARLLPG